jgi:hypothetical protein
MYRRDYRDIIAGALLVATGLFAALYAMTHFNLGTLHRVGPGMFPASAGLILAVLGLFVAIPAMLRSGPKIEVVLRPLAAALGAILVFGLTIRGFGLVPAVCVLVAVAALAEPARPGQTALLAAGLSIVTTLIFKVGLGLQVSIISWPF